MKEDITDITHRPNGSRPQQHHGTEKRLESRGQQKQASSACTPRSFLRRCPCKHADRAMSRTAHSNTAQLNPACGSTLRDQTSTSWMRNDHAPVQTMPSYEADSHVTCPAQQTHSSNDLRYRALPKNPRLKPRLWPSPPPRISLHSHHNGSCVCEDSNSQHGAVYAHRVAHEESKLESGAEP